VVVQPGARGVGGPGGGPAAAARERALRWVWAAVLAALVTTTAGNVYYSLVLAVMDSPYPSWADAGYLAF
jgi:hypothetical protein